MVNPNPDRRWSLKRVMDHHMMRTARKRYNDRWGGRLSRLKQSRAGAANTNTKTRREPLHWTKWNIQMDASMFVPGAAWLWKDTFKHKCHAEFGCMCAGPVNAHIGQKSVRLDTTSGHSVLFVMTKDDVARVRPRIPSIIKKQRDKHTTIAIPEMPIVFSTGDTKMTLYITRGGLYTHEDGVMHQRMSSKSNFARTVHRPFCCFVLDAKNAILMEAQE